MILSKGKQSMDCFWSFFHNTIGLNFKTLAHFFHVAIRFHPRHRKPNTPLGFSLIAISFYGKAIPKTEVAPSLQTS